MQTDFVAERRRRRLVLTFGLVLGIAAAAATYFLITRPQAGGPTATPASRTIVVAAIDIAARAQIEPQMLTTQLVPDNPVFEEAATDPTAVVGSIALVNIPKGQPLLSNMYGSGNPAGVTILGPEETVGPDSPIWRAVSVSVPGDRAVGGLVSPGDHIDLVVTLNPQLFDPSGGICVLAVPPCLSDPGVAGPLTGELYSAPTTKVTLTNIEILATDPDNSIYILKVDERQAEQIAHIQGTGNNSFTITLRPLADNRTFDPAPYGQTTNQLITDFGFRIPTVINVLASATPGTGPTPLPSASVLPTASP